MLFASTYTYRSPVTEESQKRVVTLFTNWEAPKGFVFKAHYAFTDGSGGFSLIEADSAAAMYEAVAPWIPYLEFHNVPIVEVESAVALSMGAIAWRTTVK